MVERTFIFNGRRLCVFVVSWGGSKQCPFQSPEDKSYHGYDYGADDVVVTNVDTKETFVYSSLLPHMIKHHHFLEGWFCAYRPNIETLLSVIGPLEKGKCYQPKRIDETISASQGEQTKEESVSNVEVTSNDKVTQFSGVLPGKTAFPLVEVESVHEGKRVKKRDLSPWYLKTEPLKQSSEQSILGPDIFNAGGPILIKLF